MEHSGTSSSVLESCFGTSCDFLEMHKLTFSTSRTGVDDSPLQNQTLFPGCYGICANPGKSLTRVHLRTILTFIGADVSGIGTYWSLVGMPFDGLHREQNLLVHSDIINAYVLSYHTELIPC